MMLFEDALQLVAHGYVVSRKAWDGTDFVLGAISPNPWLELSLSRMISPDDQAADDWEVIGSVH